MLMSVLGDDGRKNLSIGWGFLNDGESAVVQIYYPKKEGNNIFEYFANKTEMEKVIKVLEEIDFKHWKNRHWGMPIYYVNYLDKGSLTNDGCPPGFFYVNPPKESYLKLVKALMTLCFNIMKPKQYRRFAIYFNDSCEPYYRQKMKLEESRKLFKEIEYERTAPGREFE